MRKKLVVAVVLLLLTSFSMGVYADEALTYVQAIISDSVSLVFNGEEVTPVNVNGEEVPILLYEGSSYLPVRSVANLAGLNVGWDGETKSILLSQKSPVVSEDATTILDLRKDDRVFTNMFGDREVSSTTVASHSLLNEAALITREDGTVMNPGLLMDRTSARLSDMLDFNDDNEAIFGSTTVELNGEFTKITGYVKRRSINSNAAQDGLFMLYAIDVDMTLVNLPYGDIAADEETEFVYFEADVTGLDKVAFIHGHENKYGNSDDCQFIVADLLFFK